MSSFWVSWAAFPENFLPSLSGQNSQLSRATVFLGGHLGGHFDLVVFHGDRMGAVLDQVVEMQVFGNFSRFAAPYEK
jgi:hypothetical protein